MFEVSRADDGVDGLEGTHSGVCLGCRRRTEGKEKEWEREERRDYQASQTSQEPPASPEAGLTESEEARAMVPSSGARHLAVGDGI